MPTGTMPVPRRVAASVRTLAATVSPCEAARVQLRADGATRSGPHPEIYIKNKNQKLKRIRRLRARRPADADARTIVTGPRGRALLVPALPRTERTDRGPTETQPENQVRP